MSPTHVTYALYPVIRKTNWTSDLLRQSQHVSVLTTWCLWLAGVIKSRLRFSFLNFFETIYVLSQVSPVYYAHCTYPAIIKIINPPSVKVTYLWRFSTGVIVTILDRCNFFINWLKGMSSMSFNFGNLLISSIRSMSSPNSSSGPHTMSPVILFKWVSQLV